MKLYFRERIWVMKFANNLNRICKEQGTTITTILKEMGYLLRKLPCGTRDLSPNKKCFSDLPKS